jgi:hypothetical protein
MGNAFVHFTAEGVITQLVVQSSQEVHLYGSICQTYPLTSVFLERMTGRAKTGAVRISVPVVMTKLRRDSGLFFCFPIFIQISMLNNLFHLCRSLFRGRMHSWNR